jgi:hypothetical protein
MKLRIAFLVLAGVWVAGMSHSALQAQQAAKTVWDGVFSKAQADRGAAQYKAACSE